MGAVCVLTGVAQAGSPFVLKAPGAWFFGASAPAPSAAGSGTFLGVMLVYAGLAVMIGSWFEVVRTLRRHPCAPLGSVVAIAIAWALPVLVMPPLFSRDVYSYVAQGEMITRGFNPYVHGPAFSEPAGSSTWWIPSGVMHAPRTDPRGNASRVASSIWQGTTFWRRSWGFAPWLSSVSC